MTAPQVVSGTWRILVIRGRSPSTLENLIPSTNIAEELKEAPGVQVKVLDTPRVADVHAACFDFKPNVLYIWAGCSGLPEAGTSKLQHLVLGTSDGVSIERVTSDELLSFVKLVPLHVIILNVHPEHLPLMEMKTLVPHIVHWTPGHEVPAINAATFAISALGFLRQPHVTFVEAFAVGVHLLRAHACGESSGKRDPVFPVLLSDEMPDLPGCKPMAVPYIEGVDLSQGFTRSIPGWETTRLLSPVAECTLALVSLPSILDTERLAALGLALRAFLTLEVRGLAVEKSFAVEHTPSHIVPGSDVARIFVRTQSGVSFPVVIGAPTQVMKTPGLLEAALKATLTCDCISLRFQLPPYGSAAPEPSQAPAIAHGCRTTPVLLVTSVWVVSLLRALAKRANDRFLPLLGIGAVSVQAAQSFTADDAARFSMLEAQQPPLLNIPQVTYTQLNKIGGPPPASLDANFDASARLKGDKGKPVNKPDRGSTLRETKFDEITRNAEHVEQWASSRPPLHLCTAQQFLEDLMSFLQERQGWNIDRNRFPDAVLNGSNLDLWNLYREVVTRGGFKVGNGINWKGQVFTQMSNWTATHKMTGVGNALKRHYHNFLWEYERANQRDVGDGRTAPDLTADGHS